LAYLFENITSIPRSIFKLLSQDENLLIEKSTTLLKEF
jgi:hypothetical protein